MSTCTCFCKSSHCTESARSAASSVSTWKCKTRLCSLAFESSLLKWVFPTSQYRDAEVLLGWVVVLNRKNQNVMYTHTHTLTNYMKDYETTPATWESYVTQTNLALGRIMLEQLVQVRVHLKCQFVLAKVHSWNVSKYVNFHSAQCSRVMC